MQCPNCQTVLPDGTTVCPDCGSAAPTTRLSPFSDPRMLRCMRCQEPLEEGYLKALGANSPEWHSRALEDGVLGTLFGSSKDSRDIVAYRCARCGHLELFAL